MNKDLITDPSEGICKHSHDDEKAPRYGVERNFTSQEVNYTKWINLIIRKAHSSGICYDEIKNLREMYLSGRVCDDSIIEFDKAIANIIKKKKEP